MSPSYLVVSMRLQLDEGWGAGGKRTKAVFTLESGSGTLNESELVHSSFQLGVMSCLIYRPRQARTASCGFSPLSSKNFSVIVSKPEDTACFLQWNCQCCSSNRTLPKLRHKCDGFGGHISKFRNCLAHYSTILSVSKWPD